MQSHAQIWMLCKNTCHIHVSSVSSVNRNVNSLCGGWIFLYLLDRRHPPSNPFSRGFLVILWFQSSAWRYSRNQSKHVEAQDANHCSNSHARIRNRPGGLHRSRRYNLVVVFSIAVLYNLHYFANLTLYDSSGRHSLSNMPDAANNEHNTAGESSTQQGNHPSFSEHETSKPTEHLEASQHGTPANGQQTKPKQSFPKKGKLRLRDPILRRERP